MYSFTTSLQCIHRVSDTTGGSCNQDWWKFDYNLRHADDIVCWAESPDDDESLIGKVNNIVKARLGLLKLNVKHTERLKIGKI